jgi:hypothetical protein
MQKAITFAVAAFLFCLVPCQASLAQEEAELAKKLANPVSDLISVPLQYNYDENYGADDEGRKQFINIQPVIPITLNDKWNLISRTILPLVDEDDVPPGTSETGTGDTLQSLFFSPRQPTSRGWIWGVGPVFLLPTASEDVLGSEKWGIGPTAVGLRQIGPWTYGMLVNHVWSVAGDDDRVDVSSTFLQPFLSYITKTKTTITLNSESTYDWENSKWSVPVNLVVSQLFEIGKQPIQFGVGARYWVDTPEAGPEGWGARAVLTFLFPKGE